MPRTCIDKASEHPAFGKQFAEKVLPAVFVRPHWNCRKPDRHGQDGTVDAELSDRIRIGHEVEGAPLARDYSDPFPVQFDSQVSHLYPAA
jgi:hypothetical protein